jgi:polar amino acid transport system permease protein
MNFDGEVFFDALLSVNFLLGAVTAVTVAVVAQAIGILGGSAIVLAQRSRVIGVRQAAGIYTWVFRALPTLLVLLAVWNVLPQFFPVFTEPWFSPFIAACVGLGMSEAAYMAQIIRGSLMAVDDGQAVAARALGMTPFQSVQKVMLPQMIRVAIPPTSNEFINMIKYTSLASVISLQELLTRAQVDVASTFRYAEYYAVCAVYYLIICSLLTGLQNWLERKNEWSSRKKVQKTRPIQSDLKIG